MLGETRYSLSMELKTCIPSSTNPEWLQAERTTIKVVESGFTPASNMLKNKATASLPCPCEANPEIIAVHECRSFSHIKQNNPRADSMLPHFPYMSTNAFLTINSPSKPI